MRPRSVPELSADLERLGVRPGDVLMVHASLRRIGLVTGGADGVLDAIHAAIGANGTLLVNVGVRDDWSWVQQRPATERPGLLRDAVPFEAATTSADPDNGVLAEVFRTRVGTIVTDNPEGRLAASGPLARTLLDAAPWADYYGPGSPLDRFVAEGGRVLRLGADPDTVTLIHLAEYLVDLPDKRRVVRHRLVQGPTGPEVRTVSCLDDSNGIVDLAGEDYFATILREYLATGRAAHGTVGQAASELLDGAGLVAFAVAWMAEHLRG